MNTIEKRKNGFLFSRKLKIDLMYIQEGKCKICGVPEWKIKRSLQAHRIVPGRSGGLYTIDNVILLCNKCHYHADRDLKQNENKLVN